MPESELLRRRRSVRDLLRADAARVVAARRLGHHARPLADDDGFAELARSVGVDPHAVEARGGARRHAARPARDRLRAARRAVMPEHAADPDAWEADAWEADCRLYLQAARDEAHGDRWTVGAFDDALAVDQREHGLPRFDHDARLLAAAYSEWLTVAARRCVAVVEDPVVAAPMVRDQAAELVSPARRNDGAVVDHVEVRRRVLTVPVGHPAMTDDGVLDALVAEHFGDRGAEVATIRRERQRAARTP